MSAAMCVGWAVEALVASTVLMALVLLLRAPVRRAFGPDIAYALWALPVLRLLLPPLPAGWREIAAAPISAASETITIYVTAPLAGGVGAAATPAIDIVPLLVGLWVAGSALFLAFHAVAHRRFCRRLLHAQVRGSEIDGGIHLIESDAASGPLAFGVLRKYVAFPRDFVERYDQEERDLALAHELGHHARGDLIANWIALGVLALHWFNPIAWRAFRAFRADQEIANDARVLVGLSPIARHTYACAIVKSAHGGAVSAACHLHTINDLKGRLKMLTTNKTSRARLIGGAAATAVMMLAGLGLTASGTQAAASVRDSVETATGVSLARFDAAADLPFGAVSPPTQAELPVPPVPPAPPAPPTPGDRDVTTSTTTTTIDGKQAQIVKLVMRRKDGTTEIKTLPSMDALRAIPEIASVQCPGGASKQPMVINEQIGDKRRIVLCMNRIEKVGADAAAAATNSDEIERDAMQSALAGLRSGRAGIVGNTGMSEQQRATTLKAIDEAIKEVSEGMKAE